MASMMAAWMSRARRAGGPFDRMLIAQAQAENMPIISNETLFEGYGIPRIW